MQVTDRGENAVAKARSGPVFVVAHTWPDVRNAEYEVLQRLSIAAKNIGATMIAVDDDGRPLWANRRLSLDKSKPIDPTEVDFMISLHFQSPRLIDVYSYYALWQPLDFYFQFDYEQSLRKVLTHNDALSCLSDLADAHGRAVFGARGELNPAPFPTLFHNVPQPYLEPQIDDHARLFYVGINWERGSGKKGRHSGVLEMLDGEDILDIYGPRKFLGFEPWGGFASYRGELPFDGHSTVTAINKAGICLALSSEAHKRSGLMSNRLFEGLAAGAAVIVDSNRFARTHFSDAVYFIDDSVSAEQIAFQIRTIVDQIRRFPEQAAERVRKGQALLAERFALETSLQAIIAGHPQRLQHYQSTALSAGSVTVIITYQGSALDEVIGMIGNVADQSLISADVVLICDSDFHARHHQAITDAVRGSIRKLTFMTLDLARTEFVAGEPPTDSQPTGPLVAKALQALDTDYFCFLGADELWFRDHLASLVAAMKKAPGATMSVSGALEQRVGMGESARSLSELRFITSDMDVLDAQYASEYGRFLMARGVLDRTPMTCLSVLDGQEPNLVRLAAALDGDPAQTGYATYVRDMAKTEARPDSLISEEQQQQFIRDAFAFDRRWLSRMTMATTMPKHVYAYSRSAPIRFDDFRHPLGVTRNLPIGAMVAPTIDGDGDRYLAHGFHQAEREGSWIEGETGTIEFYYGDRREAAEDLDFVILMRGRPAKDFGRPQHCTVVLNGVAIAYVEVPDQHKRFAFRIPRNAIGADGRVRVQLTADHAEHVYDDDGEMIDPRSLGLHVARFGIIPRRELGRLALAKGQTYDFHKGSQGLEALVEGFSHPEAEWTSILGKSARLDLRVQGFEPPMQLLLWLSGRPSRFNGAPQTVSIFVNDQHAGLFELAGDNVRVPITLTREAVGNEGICSVDLQFAHAETMVDPQGGVIDGRLVAARLHAIGVEGSPGRNRRLVKRVIGAVLRRL
jgi:hypothetical protein